VGWAVAAAPIRPFRAATWLVGKLRDGAINAYDPAPRRFRGTTHDPRRQTRSPSTGLWGAGFGQTGVIGTPADVALHAGHQAAREHGMFGGSSFGEKKAAK